MILSPDDLLTAALQLPPETRAALADSLLESLPPTSLHLEEMDAGYDAEIAKRVEDIHQGGVELISWDDLRDRLQARLQH